MSALSEFPVNAPAPFSGARAAGQSVGGGRFLLEKILGQGGMGVVWLAQDKLLRGPVALKFLPPPIAFDPAALAGLRREAMRARRLSHPNIVRIHDVIDPPGEAPFLAMEYVDGPNLHALRAGRARPVFRWPEIAPLLRQLCAALHYAHGEGVVHRDLKPANLMLDRKGRLKLADFGLARVVTDSMSRASEPPHTGGTLCYMSPQQADGGPPQIADDVYALGATLYELLTSTPPFHAGDVGYQLRHAEPEPMTQRLAALGWPGDIPDEVSAMVQRCLAKNPAQRPPNAKAILDWLDSPEMARLETAGEPPRRDVFIAEPSAGTREILEQDGAAPFSPSSVAAAPRGARPRGVALVAALAGAAGLALLGWQIFRAPPGASRQSAEHQPSSAASESPAAAATSDGFQTIFNGRDLTGWDGDPNFWHVRDGAITAVAGEEGVQRRENTCLIWREPVDDFELRLQFRQTDMISAKPANSGVLYRARRLSGWRVQGYQAELFGDATGGFILLEDTLHDPRVEPGRSAVLRDNGGDTIAIQSTGVLTSPDQLKAAVNKGGWNELAVIVQGRRLIHQINGVVTVDATDHATSRGVLSGCLALELKRATAVQFKDIRLKRLVPSPPAPLPAGSR